MPPLVAAITPIIAGATGTGIAASTFIGPLTAMQSLGVAIGSALPTALGAMSAISGIQSSRAQADAINMTANYNAKVQEQQAVQERGVASREASEERRQGRIAASSLIAQVAKGGGGIDPTAAKILGNIAGEAEFRAGVRIASGENSARGLETGADLTRYEAMNKAKQVRREGIATALGTAGSMLFKKSK